MGRGVTIESGFTYDGVTPVIVRINRRERRCKVTDDGRAVSAAGAEDRRVDYPETIAVGDHSVNVSRQGVVWLPAVAPSDEWLSSVSALVARGSVALYEQLLELDGLPSTA